MGDMTLQASQDKNFQKKIDIFYDSNMLIDVCTSFLGLSSSDQEWSNISNLIIFWTRFFVGSGLNPYNVQ